MSRSIRNVGVVPAIVVAAGLVAVVSCSAQSAAPPRNDGTGGSGTTSGGSGNQPGLGGANNVSGGTSFGGTNLGVGGTTNPGGGSSNPGGGSSNPGGGTGGFVASGGTGGVAIMCAPEQNRCDCHTSVGSAVNKWIDTFEDGDTRIQTVDERDGLWYALPAGKAGPMTVEATSGGSPGSTKALHMSGGVLDPNWPTYGVPLGICYDASAFDGISFWIKGDSSGGKNDTIKFSLSTPPTVEKVAGGTCPDGDKGCYNHFASLITLAPTWTQYSFKWSQLTQADWGAVGANGMAPTGYEIQKHILGVNFSPNENKKGYDFWIDDVQLGAGGTTGHCGEVVSRDQFESFFPGHAALYTYDGFVEAAKQWPLFCGEGDADARKREAAAFFAHMVQETAGLKFLDEQNPPQNYCDTSRTEFPCGNNSYHGRGPLQISWNYNYGTAGRAIGLGLLNDPGLVVASSVNAFNTALWWWMTRQPLDSAHSVIVSGKGFGQTIQLINGPLECGGKQPTAVQTRVSAFENFCGKLGVATGGNEGC